MMSMRSVRERTLQLCCYEIAGIALAAPLHGLIFGGGSAEGVLLVVALFLPELLWSLMHNALFDRAEWQLTGRAASDRPHRWRIIHAVSHETTSVVVSLPLIMLLTNHGIVAALLVDLWLTAFYAGYVYLFHLAYDRLRPIKAELKTAMPERQKPGRPLPGI